MGEDEPATGGGPDGDGQVMVAIDDSGDATRVIIADVSRDGSWLSIPRAEAPTLTAWR